ncbi:DNA alkylation repair enzyme [Porphyromonas gulae]|uniref:DNA alkylation repair enzyme n=1 Tax=Porphyromonas gulae TaxID=111105 RepID=A0A099WU69_9PORP|nr:DNA alkylation repair protein [Porphyromonas gulae]KGL47650.1 DNA alkylation repair enzyme [Porphyromonas gulae]KGN79523.1 DNA alkylation repair enzyme [Porphyromonas gulae]KGN85999.1 DNA alkylation repair enzyme [Porphyromonas gulae]
MNMKEVLERILSIEHGFVHILEAAKEILSSSSEERSFAIAFELFDHEAYQARMLATAILGHLAGTNGEALLFLKDQVSLDKNWRVQEMLAKAFDTFCKEQGYEKSLPVIREWLDSDNANVVRAVTEGLRIWTSRSFFKENPHIAIEWLSRHRGHESEYVRKSVGNALKDIGKKHKESVAEELKKWDLSDPLVLFTYKHASKHSGKDIKRQ